MDAKNISSIPAGSFGYSSKKGRNYPLALNIQDVDCPQSLKLFSWWMNTGHWYNFGYDLGSRCLPNDDLDVIKFDIITVDVHRLVERYTTKYIPLSRRAKEEKLGL